MNTPIRRLVAMVLAPAHLALIAGCGGGAVRLDRKDLENPPEASTYRVVTEDGREYHFIALHLEDEEVAGTVRVTTTETVGEGETVRTNVTNRYEEVRLPWAEIATVEAEGRDRAPSGILLIGGAIVVGVGAFLLLSGGGDSTDGGGGGKGF